MPTPLLALVLSLAAAWPTPAAAQAQLNGRYTYDADASDDIPQAISTAVRGMNFVIRPMMRGHMARHERPFQWVGISFSDTQVSITTDRTRSPSTTPADGTEVSRPRSDGKVQYVSTRWTNGRLEQTIRAPRAQRLTTYALSPDGSTLTMTIRLTAPLLPQPLTYRLVYNRAQ
jgi:hypothetical protein